MANSNTYVDCAVVIVTYNSARDIARVLDSLPAAAGGLAGGAGLLKGVVCAGPP